MPDLIETLTRIDLSFDVHFRSNSNYMHRNEHCDINSSITFQTYMLINIYIYIYIYIGMFKNIRFRKSNPKTRFSIFKSR